VSPRCWEDAEQLFILLWSVAQSYQGVIKKDTLTVCCSSTGVVCSEAWRSADAGCISTESALLVIGCHLQCFCSWVCQFFIMLPQHRTTSESAATQRLAR
jgi:hypothetical protein